MECQYLFCLLFDLDFHDMIEPTVQFELILMKFHAVSIHDQYELIYDVNHLKISINEWFQIGKMVCLYLMENELLSMFDEKVVDQVCLNNLIQVKIHVELVKHILKYQFQDRKR